MQYSSSWLPGCLLGLITLLGCAGTGADSGDGDGDSTADGGSDSASGGSESASGGSTAASGGSTGDGGAGLATGGRTAGGQDGSGGSENGIAGGKNCDATQVLVKVAPPDCGAGQIPEVVNGNWGECVPLMECGCENPGSQLQCGDGLSYVCYASHRCGELL